jgi:hypothetical protein
MELKFAEVLDDRDFRRVNDLYVEAIEHSVDRVLVGFRVRGPVVRIVWAVVEVIPLGPWRTRIYRSSAIRGRLGGLGPPSRRLHVLAGANGRAG